MMERSSGVRWERSGPWLPCRGTRGGWARPWRSPSKEDSWFILQQQKSHFGLSPCPCREYSVAISGQGQASVVCERKRAEEALFLQREPPPCRVQRAEPRSHLELGRSNVGAPASPPPPSPSPHPGPRGGAEVGVEVWCEAAAPLSPPTTSAEAVTRHQPPPPPRACEAAVVVPRAEQARKPRVTEIQALASPIALPAQFSSLEKMLQGEQPLSI